MFSDVCIVFAANQINGYPTYFGSPRLKYVRSNWIKWLVVLMSVSGLRFTVRVYGLRFAVYGLRFVVYG